MKKILLVLLMLALPCTSFSAEATMPGANFWKGAAKGAATVYGVSKLPNDVAEAWRMNMGNVWADSHAFTVQRRLELDACP